VLFGITIQSSPYFAAYNEFASTPLTFNIDVLQIPVKAGIKNSFTFVFANCTIFPAFKSNSGGGHGTTTL